MCIRDRLGVGCLPRHRPVRRPPRGLRLVPCAMRWRAVPQLILKRAPVTPRSCSGAHSKPVPPVDFVGRAFWRSSTRISTVDWPGAKKKSTARPGRRRAPLGQQLRRACDMARAFAALRWVPTAPRLCMGTARHYSSQARAPVPAARVIFRGGAYMRRPWYVLAGTCFILAGYVTC